MLGVVMQLGIIKCKIVVKYATFDAKYLTCTRFYGCATHYASWPLTCFSLSLTNNYCRLRL